MAASDRRIGPLLAVMAFLASGCERQVAVPAVAPGQADFQREDAAQIPTTESGLSIKRGDVVIAGDVRTLRLCGESGDLWLVDQAASLDDTYARLTGDSGSPLYVELRGERTSTPSGTAIPAEFGQAFLLEEVLYAGVPGEGRGCAAAKADYRVLARGNEPFWSVEVAVDKMILRRPDLPAPITFPLAETLDTEGTVTYRATSDGHTLELTVSGSPCSDSMSGDYFAYTALARLDGRELHGCVRLGE